MKRFCLMVLVAVSVLAVFPPAEAEAGRSRVSSRSRGNSTTVRVFNNGNGGNHCNRNNDAVEIQVFSR